MSDKLYYYRAKVVSVYDGDTITVLADMGMSLFARIKVRLLGINTPEIRTKDADEKRRGLEARDYLREQILNQEVILHTVKRGKYGRWLGEVWKMDDQGAILSESVNQTLINNGYAVEYKG